MEAILGVVAAGVISGIFLLANTLMGRQVRREEQERSDRREHLAELNALNDRLRQRVADLEQQVRLLEDDRDRDAATMAALREQIVGLQSQLAQYRPTRRRVTP